MHRGITVTFPLPARYVAANTPILIAGAGPAGLATAITLARAGREVVVHEAHGEVGYRFKRDLQGLDNWSTPEDVLAVLHELGLTTDFTKLPCCRGYAFDAWGKSYTISSETPIFYLVKRGPGAGTLDTALLTQALQLGVEVRFHSRVRQLKGAGVVATGPKGADMIAVGYHFDTPMQDGFWVICDDNIAPQGYAYLLVMGGKGTLKSCMFSEFKRKSLYVKRTVEAFERLVALEMIDPQPHGGVGNFHLPVTSYSGSQLLAGERAGIQDFLWGFGMREAITSGVLAARSLLDGSDYATRQREALRGVMSASLVNRAAFSLLGNRGYRWFLRYMASQGDIRARLYRHFQPSPLKYLLAPLAHWITQKNLG